MKTTENFGKNIFFGISMEDKKVSFIICNDTSFNGEIDNCNVDVIHRNTYRPWGEHIADLPNIISILTVGFYQKEPITRQDINDLAEKLWQYYALDVCPEGQSSVYFFKWNKKTKTLRRLHTEE